MINGLSELLDDIMNLYQCKSDNSNLAGNEVYESLKREAGKLKKDDPEVYSFILKMPYFDNKTLLEGLKEDNKRTSNRFGDLSDNGIVAFACWMSSDLVPGLEEKFSKDALWPSACAWLREKDKQCRSDCYNDYTKYDESIINLKNDYCERIKTFLGEDYLVLNGDANSDITVYALKGNGEKTAARPVYNIYLSRDKNECKASFIKSLVAPEIDPSIKSSNMFSIQSTEDIEPVVNSLLDIIFRSMDSVPNYEPPEVKEDINITEMEERGRKLIKELGLKINEDEETKGCSFNDIESFHKYLRVYRQINNREIITRSFEYVPLILGIARELSIV